MKLIFGLLHNLLVYSGSIPAFALFWRCAVSGTIANEVKPKVDEQAFGKTEACLTLLSCSKTLEKVPSSANFERNSAQA